MMFSDTVRFRQGITNDYQGALLRLATLRAEGEHHLLFAWLEFFPFDMSLPSGWNSGEKPWTVPGSGGWTCAVSVKRLAVADALDWYEAAAKGNINIGTTKGRPVKVLTAPLGPEPVYGRFCVEANVPFTFRWHSDPRIHRYVPLTGPPDQYANLVEARQRANGSNNMWDLIRIGSTNGSEGLPSLRPTQSALRLPCFQAPAQRRARKH